MRRTETVKYKQLLLLFLRNTLYNNISIFLKVKKYQKIISSEIYTARKGYRLQATYFFCNEIRVCPLCLAELILQCSVLRFIFEML